jgi:hypothetical protein
MDYGSVGYSTIQLCLTKKSNHEREKGRKMETVIEYERYEVRLSGGDLVLGKLYKGEVSPLTYSNRAQALRAAAREVGSYVIQRGRPFFVRLPEREET